ncbi:MAG: hypothetical protein KGH75_00990 [Rhodospirillales bacterium]|nr:hypothetical protein [Rhodospirillales bacterium]
MKYLLARMMEPSTYAGLSALLLGLGVKVPAGTLHTVVFVAGVAAAAGAVVMKEGVAKALESGDAAAAAAAEAAVMKPPG